MPKWHPARLTGESDAVPRILSHLALDLKVRVLRCTLQRHVWFDYQDHMELHTADKNYETVMTGTRVVSGIVASAYDSAFLR